MTEHAQIGKPEMPVLPDFYHNPSCYWDGNTRTAIIFDKSHAGHEALVIQGNGADEIARFLIDSQMTQLDRQAIVVEGKS